MEKNIRLYQTCCGILRYIRQLKPQLDIFHDAAFASFNQTHNAEVKHWKAGGLGVHTKQVEPITPDEEELFLEQEFARCTFTSNPG